LIIKKLEGCEDVRFCYTLNFSFVLRENRRAVKLFNLKNIKPSFPTKFDPINAGVMEEWREFRQKQLPLPGQA